MIVQNLSTIHPTTYLKEDNLVLDIHTRLPLKEVYKKIAADENVSDIVVINAYRRNTDDESPLFSMHRPPFDDTTELRSKVTVPEFDGFLNGKPEYEGLFIQIPMYSETADDEECLTKEQLLKYLSVSMDILPELEDKQSLSLDEKVSLSEISRLFYGNSIGISPYNPLPSYENLMLYTSLNSYEQRVLRSSNDSVVVSNDAIALASFCKDEKLNGYGKLYVTEEMMVGRGTIPQKVAAVSDLDRVLLGDLGLTAAELPSQFFRYTTAVLSELGELKHGSKTVSRLINVVNNHWSVAHQPNNSVLSRAFATHDVRTVKSVVKENLINAGCLMPAEHLKAVLSGTASALPAELQTVIDAYLEQAATRFLEQGRNSEDDLNAFIKDEINRCYPLTKEPAEITLEGLFKEKFRRAPRVLHEILRAYQIQHPEPLTEAHLNDIVDHFNLKGFQVIANSHSHTLMNLSRYVDFSSIKTAHLQIFASKKMDVAELEKRGFFEWYNAHKNVNASELYDMLSCNIIKFDIDKSAKDLIRFSRYSKAYEEVKRIEEAWDIKFEDNDIAIKGRDIIVKNSHYTIEICDRDDPRQTYSGYDTNCCQHLGGAGQSCVKDILTNPLSGNLIITDNQTGQIVAQSYLWSDISRDALILDNMEFERSHDATARKFFPLVAKWCEQMPHKNIHIGTGYNQSFRGIGIPVTNYNFCHRTVLGQVTDRWYSDYHGSGANAARVLKQDGVVTFPVDERATVSNKPLKSSVLESTCSPEDYGLFSLSNIRSVQDLANFKAKAVTCDDENWVRNQIQSLMSAKRFDLLSLFTIIPEDLQERIFTLDSTSVPFIKNPSESVLRKYLTLNPGAISQYPNLDPNIVKHLYAQNGLLIRKAPTNDRECQKAAVRNEPLAIIYLKESPIFGELLLMAIQKDPAIIKFFPNADDSYWNKAIYRDPFTIRYKKNPTKWQKETAIKSNPAVVYSIKDAKPADFALAKEILRSYRRPTNTQAEEQSADAQFNPFRRMS